MNFLQVVVPDNWKSFLGIDAEGKATQKKLHIYKNAESELDIFHKAGITIHYGENKISFSGSDVQKIMKSIAGRREV